MRIHLKSTRHLFFKEIFHPNTGPLYFGKHGFDGIGILCVRRRKVRWQKTNWAEEGKKKELGQQMPSTRSVSFVMRNNWGWVGAERGKWCKLWCAYTNRVNNWGIGVGERSTSMSLQAGKGWR